MKLTQCMFTLVAAGAAFLPVVAVSNTSYLVYQSPTGLVYTGYSNEGQVNSVNTIPDFSTVGYEGGGVEIPFVPAAVTVSPTGGDDTAQIQGAINTVSGMSVGGDGFRGAVVLEAGNYTVSSPLTISTSGVVIRGAGSQESGGTKITYTSTTKSDLFTVSGAGSISETGGTRVSISDSYVPVGATTFQVSNGSGFSPGDRIIVLNKMNAQWISDIGMDIVGVNDWDASAYQLEFRRVITAVNGNQITIDAPIVQTIEDQYGGGDIYKYTYSGELENIGFESMRLESTFASAFDENHGWYAIKLYNLQNGWVRQVTARHFGQGAVMVDNRSQHITVEDCAMLDPKSDVAGGRRYSFHIDDSEHNLFQRCLTRGGRHDYVTGSKTPGPNAFVDCRADNTYADIGPHFKYATGQIYDNVIGGQINVRDTGGAHGWTGAQILFWNCDADSIICDTPVGAMNWCVGSTGTKTEGPGNRAFGIWDSQNTPVVPRSLYYSQLADRLGTNVLNTIILPQQKAGGIWDALYSWDGDGLFLDDLVVWADEETVPQAGVPLAVRGVVRNLPMLDNGVTASWSKLYGPETVTFADDTALETTATFSQDGAYVLQLSVDDGISAVSNNLIVRVGAGSADTTAPAQPTGLAATAGEGLVSLDWNSNGEADLAGYNVYRSTTSGSYGAALATWVTSSDYVDDSAVAGTEYYYLVTAIDTNSNESIQSLEVSAIPQTIPPVQEDGTVIASDNAWVYDFSGAAQADGEYLRTKNGWGASNSRMAYLRFNLSGDDEIGGYAVGGIESVSLDVYITQNEGEVENDLEVYALVDGADYDGAGTANLSETQWTRSSWANPLIDNNLPQGDFDPASSGLVTVKLGSHTFAGLGAGGDNQELGLLQIPMSSLSAFKTLIQNDTNGEITLIIRSTSGGTSVDFASLGNTSGQAVPTLTVIAPGLDTTPPAAPANVAAAASDGQVNLSWDANTEDDLAGYNVYRGISPGTYDILALLPDTATSYVDTTVTNGTTFYYVLTAVDDSANESAQSAEASATPEEASAYSDVTIFGSNYDGAGGFTQTAGSATEIWTTTASSVQYRNQNGGTLNSSFLQSYTFDRSNGKSYTIEGVVHLTDGYADDNNRVGIYLFGDSAQVPNENELGALGLIFNTDDTSSGGSPGSNNPDALRMMVGIDQSNLAESTRNQTIPYAQDLFGTEIKFTVDIVFTNELGTDLIYITASLTDEDSNVTTIPAISVDAAAYTGDWFGFVTRARARNYPTDPTPTAAERSLPWVMDYKSFAITETGVPVLEGFALWATGWGTDIGADTNDYELDGLINWIEYALGGNPLSNDVADILPEWSIGADGGSNWFYYTYNRREDAPELTYTVWSGTNLTNGLSNTVDVWSVSAATNGVEAATHRISTDAEPNAFMQLEIERSE